MSLVQIYSCLAGCQDSSIGRKNKKPTGKESSFLAGGLRHIATDRHTYLGGF